MKKSILLVLVLALSLSTRIAKADFIFGEPTNLGPSLNSFYNEACPHISLNGLELYFSDHVRHEARTGGLGEGDIWVSKRATLEEKWGQPVNFGAPFNTSSDDAALYISADELEAYFVSTRPGGFGGFDIWVSTRATKEDNWSEPSNLGETVNSAYSEVCPSISGDGLSLFFCDYYQDYRPGGQGDCDLYVTTRATAKDDWGEPKNLGSAVNSSHYEAYPSISDDGLMLFFSSNRPGGYGLLDLWVTTRATVSDSWRPPINLGGTINSLQSEATCDISADGSTLYIMSRRLGGYGEYDLWQAPVESVVDLNGDGIVDAADMCIIVDHWGTDELSCDVGPMPWGDGVVDVQDLIVLAEHLFEDVSLLAHWKLDEAEGNTAHDNAGDTNGTLAGDPVWQPDGGMVAGALQFDGIDDYVSTEFVLNPADGAFSVFAWIKGGAPGQAIISQADDFNWLCVDASEGNLMTELRYVSRGDSGAPLVSQTPIIDDLWHCVGLCWDGTNRILYVDDVEVAKDTQPGLVSLGEGLYIGAGKNPEEGTLWSGLIDDIRIYNRAVSP